MLEKYKHIRVPTLLKTYNTICNSLAKQLNSSNGLDNCLLDIYKELDVYHIVARVSINNKEYISRDNVKRNNVGVISTKELSEISQILTNNLKSQILYHFKLIKENNA